MPGNEHDATASREPFFSSSLRGEEEYHEGALGGGDSLRCHGCDMVPGRAVAGVPAQCRRDPEVMSGAAVWTGPEPKARGRVPEEVIPAMSPCWKILRRPRPALGGRSVWLSLVAVAWISGCATYPKEPVGAKLHRVGLEIVTDAQAQVPPAERGRYVPCRVLPGYPSPALPEHPAGYLIDGVAGKAAGADAIWKALEDWRPGETLELKVRRNPYADAGPESWDARVLLKLPPP